MLELHDALSAVELDRARGPEGHRIGPAELLERDDRGRLFKHEVRHVVTGGDATENAERLRKLLDGEGAQAEQDIVILNAAALLLTAGKADTLKAAADLARDALLSGKSGKVLDRYIEASHG